MIGRFGIKLEPITTTLTSGFTEKDSSRGVKLLINALINEAKEHNPQFRSLI